MNATLQQVLPVAVSILVIIVIAVVQSFSKTVAAITATMPLTIPLALWIIAADTGNSRDDLARFTDSLFVGVGATLIFTVALWLAARAGLGLIGMLLVAYGTWAGVLGAYFIARAALS